MTSDINDVVLSILPCRMSDIGSQRCWLGPRFMKARGLRTCDIIAVNVERQCLTYLCRAWPRMDDDGDSYIQFDKTVGISFDGIQTLSRALEVHRPPFTVSQSAVCSVSCSALKYILVSVVLNKRQEISMYKHDDSSLLESRVRHLLKGLVVSSSCTISCSSMTLGSVYDWDRVIVHETVTKQQTVSGFIVDSTEVAVKQLCCKEKFEQNLRGSLKLGGLNREIQILKDVVIRPWSSDEDSTVVDSLRGVLLTGLPGCGKKSLVRHIAVECDAFVVHVDSSVHGTRPGDSERNLRAAFRHARDVSSDECCILFLDELDAICPRHRDAGNEGDSLATRMLAELVSLMDELQDGRDRFVVVATTSKPTDIEPCLRRFGRFEKEIFVGIPGELQRLEILQLVTPHKAMSDDVSLPYLSSVTAGFTGADLTSLISVAVVSALDRTQEMNGKPLTLQVTMADFNAALHLVRPSIQGASDMFIANKKPVSWDDIGGLNDVKQQLIQSIEWPRKYPDICRKFGLQPPRGILLYGPPGCAKTSLARAAASSCSINFLAASSAQLYSPYFGDAEKQIDELFRQARACAPSLLFIDEIDSVIGSRVEADSSSSTASVQQRVLSALLTQMDGVGMCSSDVQRHPGRRKQQEKDGSDDHELESMDEVGVLVMAATNRLDMVDAALLRPGRMDHVIYIPPPDSEARLEILKVYTRDKPVENVDLVKLMQKTDGFTGADLENLCNEASLYAIHTDGRHCRSVTGEHFDAVLSLLQPSVRASDMTEYVNTNELQLQSS